MIQTKNIETLEDFKRLQKGDLIAVELKELEESNKNGMDWFDSYQDIDNFIFNELDKKGLEFITEFEKPELNTIASIKLLMCNCG